MCDQIYSKKFYEIDMITYFNYFNVTVQFHDAQTGRFNWAFLNCNNCIYSKLFNFSQIFWKPQLFWRMLEFWLEPTCRHQL